MTPADAAHRCSCGTRLARDNRTGRCGACQRSDRDRFHRPPETGAGFWDHPDICAALTSRHFGHLLRAYRCHPAHGRRPLPQGIVARWLGITQAQLSRVENGRPPRDLDRLVAWAQLLRVPEHLLWFRLPFRPAAQSSSPRRTPSCAPVGGGDDLAAVYSLRAADRRVGGGYLYATVITYLRQSIAPRLFGGGAEDSGVFLAAAGLSEMAGWMAHDAGRDSLARQHFHRALGLARSAPDSQLAAHVLGSLSHLAHQAARPDRALAYAEQGVAQLALGPPHAGVKARLFAMRARAHAAARDADRCVVQLRQAERALTDARDESVPGWVSAFDEASLATEAARCFRLLGDLGAARREADRVVGLRPRERARSRALAQLIQISVLVAQGRVDEACGIARQVVDATRGLGSYLVVRQLDEFDRSLRPYHGSREVAAFREHLGVALAERRWLPGCLPHADDRPEDEAAP